MPLASHAVQLPLFQQPRRLLVLSARRLSLRGKPKSASQSNVHMQPICGLHSPRLTQLMRLAICLALCQLRVADIARECHWLLAGVSGFVWWQRETVWMGDAN